MMTQRILFTALLAIVFVSGACSPLAAQTAVASQDCITADPPVISGSAPVARFTRIYIGAGGTAHFGDGKTADRPLDGSTTAKLDALLRGYSGNPVGDASAPAVTPASHLIVCFGPGVFQTDGGYDFVVNLPHTSSRGFAVGPYWHIHGAGIDKTTVQLVSFYVPVKGSPVNKWVHPGENVVFETVSDSSQGIEISDLTIDANYPALKPRASAMGVGDVDVDAIHLRSDEGGHFVHHLKVINAAGEAREGFPIWIYSANNPYPPAAPKNVGNVVEHVSMSNFGKGKCTAIAIANAAGEIRFNRVESYFIAYGGWHLTRGVRFHDNVAVNTVFGFNIDSLINIGPMIDHNQIIHPAKYGIVIGETGSFRDFEVHYNTIVLNTPRSIGILLQGHVSGAVITGNSITVEGTPGGVKAFATKGSDNTGSSLQYNKLHESLGVDDTIRKSSCAFSNQSRNLPDTQAKPCVPGQ